MYKNKAIRANNEAYWYLPSSYYMCKCVNLGGSILSETKKELNTNFHIQ